VIIPGSASELGLSLYIVITSILVNAISQRVNGLRDEFKEIWEQLYHRLGLYNDHVLSMKIEVKGFGFDSTSLSIFRERFQALIELWAGLEGAVGLGVLAFVTFGIIVVTTMFYIALTCMTEVIPIYFIVVYTIPIWIVVLTTASRIFMLTEAGEELETSVSWLSTKWRNRSKLIQLKTAECIFVE
jgi:hypothetical protein